MKGMTKKQGDRIIELLEGILGNQPMRFQTASYADGIFIVNCPHCSNEVAVDESQLEQINTQLSGQYACPIEGCGKDIGFPNAEEAAELKAWGEEAAEVTGDPDPYATIQGDTYMSPEQLEALTGSRTGLAVADPPEGLPPLKSAPAVLGMLPVAPLTLPAAPAPDQGVPTSNVAEELPPQSPSKKKSTVRIGVPQDPYAKQTVKDLDPHRLIFMPESEWHSDAKQIKKNNMPAGDGVPTSLIPQQLKDLPEHQREKAAKKTWPECLKQFFGVGSVVPDPYATIQGDTVPGAPAPPSKKKSTVRIGVPQKADAKQTIKINMPAGDAVPAPLPQQLKDLPEHQREKAAKKMVKDLEAFGYEVKKPKD